MEEACSSLYRDCLQAEIRSYLKLVQYATQIASSLLAFSLAKAFLCVAIDSFRHQSVKSLQEDPLIHITDSVFVDADTASAQTEAL